MPATGTGRLHRLSLLLLAGLPLLAGSWPLEPPSAGRPHLPAAGLPGSSAPAPEGAPLSAASARLPAASESPEPPAAAAGGAWDPAIMSSQKATESSHPESRTSTSATESAEASNALDNDEGRTLWLSTDGVPVSTAAIGRTPPDPETVQSGGLAQDSSSVMQTRGADVPSNTLDIAELETVPLMTHLPHTPVSLLSEHNFSATGSSHHRDSSWDVESTTLILHTERTESSVFPVNRERTSQFLADSVTLTESATKIPVSQMEITGSSDQTQFPSQATQSGGRSASSNITQFPDTLARIVLTHSYLSPNTAILSSQKAAESSHPESRTSTSATESAEASSALDNNEGRTLRLSTDGVSVSTAAIGRAPPDPETVQSGGLAQDSSSVMQTTETVQSGDLTQDSSSVMQTTETVLSSDLTQDSSSVMQTTETVQSGDLTQDSSSVMQTTETLQSGDLTQDSSSLMQTTEKVQSGGLAQDSSSVMQTTETLQSSDLTQDSSSVMQTTETVQSGGLAQDSSSVMQTTEKVQSGGLAQDSSSVMQTTEKVQSGGLAQDSSSVMQTTETVQSGDLTQDSSSVMQTTETLQSSDLTQDSSSVMQTTETVQSGDLTQDSSSVMQTTETVQSGDLTQDSSSVMQTTETVQSGDLTQDSSSVMQTTETVQSGDLTQDSSSVMQTTETLQSSDLTQDSSSVMQTTETLQSSDLTQDSSSVMQTTETLQSSDLTQDSSSVMQTRGADVPSNTLDIAELETVPLMTHLPHTPVSLLSEHNFSAAEGDDLLGSSSSTESQTDSVSILDVSDRRGGRTPQTLTDNISHSHDATQISISSSNEISSSLSHTHSSYLLPPEQTGGINLSTGDMEFTEIALVPSQAHSETTDVRTEQQTFSTSNTGKRGPWTESTFSSVASIGGGNGALESLTNSSKFTETASFSTFNLEGVSSSYLTQASSVTVDSGRNPTSSKETHFTGTSEESLLIYSPKTSNYSPSTIDLSSPGKSYQLVNVSDPQGRISSASTDSLYLSTTFMHGAERTLRSLPDNSTTDAEESSISNTEASSSSNPTLTLTSVADSEEYNVSLSERQFTERSTEPLLERNVSLSEGQFTEQSTEPLLEHSSLHPVYTSSSEDASTIGSGHHGASSSGTETRASHSSVDTMSHSVQMSSGEAQTLPSVMNATFMEVTESSSSYLEKSSASELNHSLSGIYSEMSDFSGKDSDTSGPSTETVQSFTSSRITTYSSFQSEPSGTENGFQTMDSSDMEKRSSFSHTDSIYISTPFTKGGERTLLSVSTNSTSFYAEIASPSESTQSTFSVTQNTGSNLSSSDRDFSAPSTEPLAVRSLQTAGDSSTVSYSVFQSTSASGLPYLSSQATFLQSSLPPTQRPPSFSSSESSWLASSSAFPTLFSSQTPSLTPLPRQSSTALPTFSPFLSTLPAPASTSSRLQPGINLETGVSEPEGTTGIDSPTAGSSTSEYNNHTRTYPLKDNTGFSSTGSSLLQTETTKPLTNHSALVTISPGKTESSQEQNISLPGTSVGKSVPILTTSPAHLSESTTASGTAEASSSVLPKTATQKDVFSLVEVTTRQNLPNRTGTMLGGLPTLAPATEYSVTIKTPKVPSPTEMSHTSTRTTKGMEVTRAPPIKVTEHPLSTTHPPKTFSSSKPTTRPFSALPLPTKPTTVAGLGKPNTSTTSDGKDIDECLSNPCPVLATCANTPGSFRCICSLGYRLEKGKCNLVRTFVGHFPLTFNTTGGKYSELRQIEEDIITTLNSSLSALPGYYTSTVQASRQSGTVQVSVTSTFSVVSNVTLYDIVSTVRSHIRACKASPETCQFMSSLLQLHRAGGLCKHKDPECDKETSACVDFDGIAECRCKTGYFRYNKLDHSCRACEDGYKLENDTCVSCPFGLGGFNCGNPYQLITIVIAAAGGGLLLILGTALIVTCCQKNKNDISKLIFKSGDFQMSPYAEYPKTPRTQDWGRETIEMQENGSTKNLLQMTDVYYMPTNLRNPELERNGLYPPYTGLPGSRHSCIYPGQYNPSFVSDDSRRRDYF